GVLGAERASRHLELGDVVVLAEAAVRLPHAVAPDVVSEANPRRDLVAEPEIDAGVLFPERRHVLVLGPDAGIDRQPAVDGPAVLRPEAPVVRGHRAAGERAAD